MNRPNSLLAAVADMVFMLGPSESCCISGLYGIAGVSEGTFCHYSPAALVKFTLTLSRRRWYLRVISALAWALLQNTVYQGFTL